MFYKRTPDFPEAILSFEPALVGRAARSVVAGTPLRLMAECAITLDEASFKAGPGRAAVADGARPESWQLDGWRVWLAPEGLDAHLRSRCLPLDALGVRFDGRVADPLDARSELANGVLNQSASLDGASPLMPLRALALATETGLAIDDETLAHIGEVGRNVLRGRREAMGEVLSEILLAQKPDVGLDWMHRAGLMALVLPEFEALVGFHRSARHHHKDVWRHTCQVVAQSVPRYTVRWAALFHDIGKVYTRSYEPQGRVHFFGHDDVGAYMFEGIAARLNIEPAKTKTITALIQHHLRPSLYHSSWKDAAVRRFDREMNPILTDLLHLARADVTSARPGVRRRAIHSLFELRGRIDALRASALDQRNRVPRGLGIRIISDLQIPPGRRVGELRHLCEEAVRSGILTENPAVEECIEFLKNTLAA